ncbi:MAG: hypothetical protein Q8P82_02225 [bacterium]|nr:hypothetical protein [bacterium]
MQKGITSTTWLFIAAGVFFAGLIGIAVYKKAAPSKYDAFAQCLTEKGAKMYGAWWCPHCENQKKLLGSSFRYINYIECSPGGTRAMSAECQTAGIKGYPTWEFPDGMRASGELSIAELAEGSQCSPE